MNEWCGGCLLGICEEKRADDLFGTATLAERAGQAAVEQGYVAQASGHVSRQVAWVVRR